MAKKAENTPDDSAREAELESRLNREKMPGHIAIIMDGNGRWAKEHGFRRRAKGHEAGITSVQEAVENCARLQINALTLYAFSRENWQRPKEEINALMRFLRKFLIDERPRIEKHDIRLIASGSLDDLPEAPREALDETMRLSKDNKGMTLNLALSYSGRQEIVDAAKKLAGRVRAGQLEPENIDIGMFGEELYSPDIGDPDLLIRTSGEFRISNFLLWELAYTEIHITPVLWPDFRKVHLLEAILDYQKRDRRFGKVSSIS
ncbi:MAG: polyprenyl diphosphate synthase [Candidatus Sumerlaeia bacterium]